MTAFHNINLVLSNIRNQCFSSKDIERCHSTPAKTKIDTKCYKDDISKCLLILSMLQFG